jgi:hypothetical protein
MSSRAMEDTKSNKQLEEAFDFPETSDMCDFGYVLAGRAETPSVPPKAHSQSAK